MSWASGQTLGAAGSQIKLFARNRYHGASVASGFVLFVNVGAEWKSFHPRTARAERCKPIRCASVKRC